MEVMGVDVSRALFSLEIAALAVSVGLLCGDILGSYLEHRRERRRGYTKQQKQATEWLKRSLPESKPILDSGKYYVWGEKDSPYYEKGTWLADNFFEMDSTQQDKLRDFIVDEKFEADDIVRLIDEVYSPTSQGKWLKRKRYEGRLRKRQSILMYRDNGFS